MLKKISLLVALVAIVAALAVGAAPAQALTAPYFATNLPESGIMGQMVNQPQAVRHDNKTYIAYQGPGLDPYVAAYDWNTKQWDGPYQAGTSPQTTDTHGAPAIYIDDTDYIHVYFGPHKQALLQSVSTYPNRIDAWTVKAKIPAPVTYPQIVRVGAKVLLFYRGDNMDWFYRDSSNGSDWSGEYPVTAAAYPKSLYASFREGPNNSVLMGAVAMDWDPFYANQTYGRHDVYFAQLKDADRATNIWRNGKGDALPGPIKRADVSAETTNCLVQPLNPLKTTNIPVPGMTADGRLGMMWNEGIENVGGPASREYKFAAIEEGGDWTTPVTLATTDHIYDAVTWRAEKLEGEATKTVAYVETGGTKGIGGGTVWDYIDIGGEIHRLTSNNGGVNWIPVNGAATRISPAADSELGGLLGRNGIYHNPHLVTHDAGDADARDTVIFQEQCPDASIEGYAGYLYGPSNNFGGEFPKLVGRTYSPVVTRLAAADRYSEAALVAKKAFPQGTANVIIASGETFADALVAAPLAKALDAPILLVRHDTLPSATSSAISYLGATKAYVVGGKVTVEDGVVKQLKATRISQVERIAAANRYDTAALVAQKLFDLKGSPEVVYVANGEKFADGLSIGAVAASLGQPVLLVKPTYVPPAVGSTIAKLTPADIVIVGGPASVSAGTAEQLGAKGRLDGLNRYEVADKVAAYGIDRAGLSVRRAVVVTGRDFPDCLTTAVLASRLKGVVLLTPTPSLSVGAAAHLRQYRNERLDVYVGGGTASVSAATFEQVKAAVALP